MNQGKNKKLTDRKGSPTNRSAPEQEDTDPTLSDATPPRLRADIDIEAMDESSAEFSAVMSLLSRVRSQPASEQKMFSGSFISGIGTNFADGLQAKADTVRYYWRGIQG
jgi:hypothetical protein